MKTQPKTIVINVPSITVRKLHRKDFTDYAKKSKSWLSNTLTKAAKALED